MKTPLSIDASLSRAYDDWYHDGLTPWRELGATGKTRNILALCGGRSFARILEWGAGEGSILQRLAEAGIGSELHALEVSPSGVDAIRKRRIPGLASVELFDGYRTSFADGHFDLCVLSHVLEHVEHVRPALREIRRISKQQVIEVPCDYCIGVDTQAEHYLSYGHINVFTPSTLRFLLKSEGFAIVADRHSDLDLELRRYDAYQNHQVRRNVFSETRLRWDMLRKHLVRLRKGRRYADEFTYDAYTVLASSGTSPASSPPAPGPFDVAGRDA